MIACAPHSPAPSPAGFRPSHFVEGPTTGDTSRAEIQTGTELTCTNCVFPPLASPMIQTGSPLTCRMELGQRYKQDRSKHTLHVCSILGHTGSYWAILGATGPYWSILGHTGLYWTIQEHTGGYWALLGQPGGPPCLRQDTTLHGRPRLGRTHLTSPLHTSPWAPCKWKFNATKAKVGVS